MPRGLLDHTARTCPKRSRSTRAALVPWPVPGHWRIWGSRPSTEATPTKPSRYFGRALELYAEAGAAWDAGRVRGRLRALGVRRRLVAAQRPGMRLGRHDRL